MNGTMLRRAALCLAALSLVSLGSLVSPSSTAYAAEPTATSLDAPHTRRSGLALGFSLGGGIGSSSGYPNDSTKIDQPGYYSASGLLGGRGGSLFVMGALADYLNFGLMLSTATFQNGNWRSTGGGIGFRVEAFPLIRLAPKLADFGIFTQFGLGYTTLSAKAPGFPEADGLQSFIGVGAFYEWKLWSMLGGHVSAGPSLEYDAIFSRPIERHGALVGARLVFYGGP